MGFFRRTQRKLRGHARGVVPLALAPEPGAVSGGSASPADAGISVWPQCATCSNARGIWIPVEGYRVEDGKSSALSIRKMVWVVAECSHGRKMEERYVQRESAGIEVPYYWGEAQVIEAVRQLRFFIPGVKAESRMLV